MTEIKVSLNGYHERTIRIEPTEAYGYFDGAWNYSAIDSDTYDGPGSPIGFGRTPELAKEDLLCQIADANLEY